METLHNFMSVLGFVGLEKFLNEHKTLCERKGNSRIKLKLLSQSLVYLYQQHLLHKCVITTLQIRRMCGMQSMHTVVAVAIHSMVTRNAKLFCCTLLHAFI